MIKRSAYQFRIEPNGKQRRQLVRFCGCSRFVFNHFLAQQNTAWEQYKECLEKAQSANQQPLVEKPTVRYVKMTEELTVLKKEKSWLNDCHSQVLQQSLKDLDRSFQNFFKGLAGYPQFKAKGKKDSIRYPQGFKVDESNGRIFLPKIGWVKYRQSQAIEGKIKNITVKFVCGYWYASVQTECAFETPIPQGGELGVDMGVAHTITTDQGEHFDLPTTIKKGQAQIAKLQKQLKNKVKGSNNRRKLIQKIAKEHHRIACIRQDFLHKVSTQLSKNHAMIFVEDLNIRGMTKSAAGTIDAPGKNVKAKSGLNRSILNQGWGEFLRQLDYKLLWNGGYLVKVNPAYTSQICPRCGYVSRNNRRTQSDFVCVECGFAGNADIVGAMNVKRAGHAQLACEVNDVSRQQQEPTEVTQLLLQ